jgi:ABC-type polysaccharide/polyol phosphate export permease
MSTTTTEAPAVFHNTAVRHGPLTLLWEAMREIWSRRRLVRYLVQADVRRRGVNTVLGNLWWVLDPLLLMLVYLVFVAVITTRSIPDFPLFLFSVILPWKWFTVAVTDSANSVVSQQRLIKQIAFPKIVLPVSSTIAGIVGFGFGLIPLLGILLLFPDRLSWFPVFIPVVAVVQFVFTLAIGILVAAGNVFFRDLGNVIGHLLRLWFYLSPGLYSLAQLDDVALLDDFPVLHTLITANPFAILFEAYRTIIYGSPEGLPTFPDFGALGVLLVVSLVLLATTTVIFKRLEPSFAKVL